MKGKKTYAGIAILAIPALARAFGLDITEADATQFVDQIIAAIEAISVVAGTVLAAYGRYDATRK